MKWKCRDRSIDVGSPPIIMGILNMTPDSFSDGGQIRSVDEAVQRALAMLDEGARIIDVGGESTRPGAASVPEEEELQRVIPVVEAIRKASSCLISIDTSKSVVARQAIAAGADIINDISALTRDPEMVAVASDTAAGVVLMHMAGDPQTMQSNPVYSDVVEEVVSYLRHRVAECQRRGIPAERLVVDPGIGFGKTVAHNLQLLANLDALQSLAVPVLVGVSRKSFIGKTLGRETDERLAGTLAATAVALERGAAIFRVHDVKETCDFLTLVDKLAQAKRL